jgi:hypothetical protein
MKFRNTDGDIFNATSIEEELNYCGIVFYNEMPSNNIAKNPIYSEKGTFLGTDYIVTLNGFSKPFFDINEAIAAFLHL